MLGSARVGYSISEGYTNLSPPIIGQELVQQVGLALPLVSFTELSTSTGLGFSFAVTDSLSARGTRLHFP